MTACWPRARPAAGDRAVIKAAAADFRVSEIPACEPAGEGEHLWLQLRKTGLATTEVARWLAGCLGVAEQAVGYAGMKDKRAVADQWFSVHLPQGGPAAQHVARLPSRDDLALLGAARHRRKLRRGELAGNRFRLRLTAVTGEHWPERLAAVRDQGAPNYFGAQRFGWDNLDRARAWLGDGGRGRAGAFHKGLYLSVLRSFLFNEVLAARVAAGSWCALLPGDVPIPIASASGTPVDGPSGPLWGRGRSPVTAEAAAIEQAALAPHGALCDGLEHVGLAQARRSLVLRAPDLQWHADAGAVIVEFSLPPGCYATTLLGEVFELSEPVALAS